MQRIKHIFLGLQKLQAYVFLTVGNLKIDGKYLPWIPIQYSYALS